MSSLTALFALLTLVLAANPAVAHSLLLESAPAANSVLADAPSVLRLRFNNRIEKRLSRVRLADERGATRDLPVAEDGALDWLTASVPTMAPGRYRVQWQVLSSDGHVVTGHYTFTIKATP